MKSSRRPSLILALVVCAAGLGCDQPVAPSPPPPPPPDRPSGLGTATVAGQVIDADTGQPVGDAVVTIESVSVFSTTRGGVYSPDGVGTSTVSDGGGGFRLEPGVRDNWLRISLSVRRDGYESWDGSTQTIGTGIPIDALVLAVYPTLIVRPGESIQTRVHLRHYTCSDNLSPCRRVVIESTPGEPVEVELVPPALDNGLEHGPATTFEFAQYQRRLTVSGGGEVYIVGGSSPVTLTARRP